MRRQHLAVREPEPAGTAGDDHAESGHVETRRNVHVRPPQADSLTGCRLRRARDPIRRHPRTTVRAGLRKQPCHPVLVRTGLGVLRRSRQPEAAVTALAPSQPGRGTGRARGGIATSLPGGAARHPPDHGGRDRRLEPPFRFADLQVRGPYRYWEHTHTFAAVSGGTEISDHIVYRLPGGPLAPLADRLGHRALLSRLFAYRTKRLTELLARP